MRAALVTAIEYLTGAKGPLRAALDWLRAHGLGERVIKSAVAAVRVAVDQAGGALDRVLGAAGVLLVSAVSVILVWGVLRRSRLASAGRSAS